MSAKKAMVWLLVLTVVLVALTVVVHFAPLPLPRLGPAPTPVVLPSPDEPTLVASLSAVSAPGSPPPAG